MRPYVVLFLAFVFVFPAFKVYAQTPSNGYECKVTIDLVNVSKEKDRVHVTIVTPSITAHKVRYVMPEYLPGIGNKVDAGQFLHQFYALDDRGMPIKVSKKHGGNVVLLKLGKGRSLRKIDYWIDDTWDVDGDGNNYHNDEYNFVPNAAGTSFESGQHYLLNIPFMFGYIDGYAWIPYRLSVIHDASLQSFTALNNIATLQSRDEFTGNSYSELSEYPLYYGTPDTIGWQSDNIYIDIACYSETGTVTARQLRRYLGAEVAALTRFLGDVKPGHYKMFFYLVSPKDFKAGTKGVFGGVSHRQSAFYYLLESADDEQLYNTVLRESSGDMLKLIPLLDQTRCSGNSDFLKPHVTQSWWLSEGMRSYFSWIAELRDSVTSEEEFMNAVSAKIRLSEKIRNKSLTQSAEMAKGMHDPLVAEQYKAKAMLTAFLLDINITQLTGGDKGLREFVLGLCDSALFRCDSLEKFLIRNVSPDIGVFFNKYIRGSTPLGYIENFDKIGWVYAPTALDSMLTFGQISLYYDETADAFFVRQTIGPNALTLQPGDRLVSINGVHVDAANLETVLASIYAPQSTEAVEVIFIRGNQNERVMAAPYFRTLVIDHIVRIDPASNADAQLLHARIFSPFDY